MGLVDWPVQLDDTTRKAAVAEKSLSAQLAKAVEEVAELKELLAKSQAETKTYHTYRDEAVTMLNVR